MSAPHQRRIEYAQNFLHSSRLVGRLVAESNLNESDVVLEIGPGDGIITEVLIQTCCHVVAVEKDPVQVERLRRRFANKPGLTLFHGDFLEFPLPQTPYKVFASIPYNATAAIVGKLTSGLAPPDDAHLVVQSEAASRFIAEPIQTLVGLQLKPWFEPSIAFRFRRTDFRPVPGVDSVLFKIERRQRPLIPPTQRQQFLDFVVSMFTAWKATVRQAARATFPRDVCAALDRTGGRSLDRRPSEIGLDVWIAVFQALIYLDDPRAWMAIAGSSERLEREQANLTKRRRTSVSSRQRR
jgi:23S rRNA (adenine-N6)-dimethyltransferase